MFFFTVFIVGPCGIFVILPAMATKSGHGYKLVMERVGEDPAAVEAKAEELGGRVLASAKQSSDGRAAILTDPTGAAFGIHRWPIDLETYPEADHE